MAKLNMDKIAQAAQAARDQWGIEKEEETTIDSKKIALAAQRVREEMAKASPAIAPEVSTKQEEDITDRIRTVATSGRDSVANYADTVKKRNTIKGDALGASFVSGVDDVLYSQAEQVERQFSDSLKDGNYMSRGGMNAGRALTEDETQDALKRIQEILEDPRARANKTAELTSQLDDGFVKNIAAPIARSLPGMAADMALIAATGGAAAGAKIAGSGAGAVLKKLGRGAANMAVNPALIPRGTRYYNQAYNEAISSGADEEQAAKAAIRTSIPSALIEGAGGLDNIARQLLSGKVENTAVRVIAEMLKTANTEGMEEVAQGVISRAAQKGTYAPDTEIIDPQSMAQEYGVGAVAGLTLGSGMKMVQGALNTKTGEAAISQAQPSPTPVDIATELMLQKLASTYNIQQWSPQQIARVREIAQQQVEAQNAVDNIAVDPTGMAVYDRAQIGAISDTQQAARSQAQVVIDDFNAWRKTNFSGAFGKVSNDDLGALKQLYLEETGIDVDAKIADIYSNLAADPGPLWRLAPNSPVPGSNVTPNMLAADSSTPSGRMDTERPIAEPLLTNTENANNQKADLNFPVPEGEGNLVDSEFGTNSVQNAATAGTLPQDIANVQEAFVKAAEKQYEMPQNNGSRDDVKIVPGETWVMAKDRGNYGKVVGMGYETNGKRFLEVYFHNKKEGISATKFMPIDMLTAVRGDKVPSRIKNMASPDSTNGKRLADSEFATNSVQKATLAGVLPQTVGAAFADTKHAVISQTQTQKAAQDVIDNIGVDGTYDYLTAKMQGKQALSSTETAAVTELMRRFGKDSASNDRLLELTTLMVESAGDTGRALNALKLLNDMSPEGFLKYAQQQTTRKGLPPLTEQEIADIAALGRLANEGESLSGLSTIERAQRIKDLTEGMSKKYQGYVNKVLKKSETGEAADWFTLLSQKVVDDKAPSSGVDKFRAMQRINLLLNPKTQIRNIGGNLLHGLAESGSNIFAAGVDKLLGVRTGNRTASLPQPGAYVSGMKKGVADTNLAMQTGLIQSIGNRYTDNQSSPTNIFGDKGLGKAGNALNDATSYLLTVGDKGFSSGRAADTLEQIRVANKGELPAWAQEVAENEGRVSTFQQDNKLANVMQNVRSTAEDAGAIPGMAAYATLPFAKTPTNILGQAISYSPVGLANGIYKAIKVGIKGNKATPQMQRNAAMAVGRGLIGSLLAGAGSGLAQAGRASGDAPDDKDEAAFQRASGKQPNSIKIGDTWVDFSTMAPIPTAINVGASVYNELQGVDGLEAKDALGIVMALLDAPVSDVTQDSLWQGIMDFVGKVDEGDWQGAVTDMAGNMATQMVPFNSFLRAVAQSVDPYLRETSAEQEAGWVGNKIKASVPGMSQTLPKRYDVLGEELERYPTAETEIGRVLRATLSPFTATKDKTDNPVLSEIEKLYNKTGDKALFPSVAPYSITHNGENYSVRGSDRSDFQRQQGQTANKTIADAINTPEYKKLSTEEKSNYLAQALEYSREKAKGALLGGKEVDYEASIVDKAEELAKVSIGPGRALLYKQLLNRYSGEGSAEKKRKFLYDSKNLAPTQKKALALAYVGDAADKYDWTAPTYDEFMFSAESENKQSRWQYAEKKGMSVGDYSDMYNIVWSGQTGYTKEDKIADLMKAQGWTQKQAETFWDICRSSKYGS